MKLLGTSGRNIPKIEYWRKTAHWILLLKFVIAKTSNKYEEANVKHYHGLVKNIFVSHIV